MFSALLCEIPPKAFNDIVVTGLSRQTENKVQAMPRLVSLYNSNFLTNFHFFNGERVPTGIFPPTFS